MKIPNVPWFGILENKSETEYKNKQTKEELLVLLVTKVQKRKEHWIPAYAGMTETEDTRLLRTSQ